MELMIDQYYHILYALPMNPIERRNRNEFDILLDISYHQCCFNDHYARI